MAILERQLIGSKLLCSSLKKILILTKLLMEHFENVGLPFSKMESPVTLKILFKPIQEQRKWFVTQGIKVCRHFRSIFEKKECSSNPRGRLLSTHALKNKLFHFWDEVHATPKLSTDLTLSWAEINFIKSCVNASKC